MVANKVAKVEIKAELPVECELTPAEVWTHLSGLPIVDVHFDSDGESTISTILLTLDWSEVEKRKGVE